MGRRPLAFLAAALLGPASAVLVSCGDRSGLIPGENADRLKNHLDSVQNALINGECERAQRAAAQVALDARGIPATVDQRLQQAVNEGAGALQTQVPEQCEEGKTDTDTESTEPTEPTEPTQPTEPTEPTPAPEPTEPTEPAPPPPVLPEPPPGDDGGVSPGNETGGGIQVPPVDPGGGRDPSEPQGEEAPDGTAGASGGSP